VTCRTWIPPHRQFVERCRGVDGRCYWGTWPWIVHRFLLVTAMMTIAIEPVGGAASSSPEMCPMLTL